MPSFFVEPEQVKLYPFGDDEHWIEVKKTLNAGEARRIATSIFGTSARQEQRTDPDANRSVAFDIDLEGAAFVKVCEYLVDWSLTRNGKNVEIDTRRKKMDALRALDPEAYQAIEKAIDEHQARQSQEKKPKSAVSGSAPLSGPESSPAGATQT